MVSSAERMAMDVLATMSNGSTATDRALKRGSDIPPVDVSAEAARDTSVGPSSAIATRSTGPVGPTGKNGLGELGNTKREPGHDDAGTLLSEEQCGGGTDATARAGDEDGLTFKNSWHW